LFTLRLLGGLSLETPDGQLSGRAAQQRRLALLALLGSAPAATLRRERVIGYLWSEHGQEQARRLVSVAVYELRRALGEEALLTHGDDLALNLQRMRVDALEFQAAVGRAAWSDAASWYRGPFLDGVFLADAPEFERWQSSERERFQQLQLEALEGQAQERAAGGDARGSAAIWQQMAVLDPFSARVAVGLMTARAAAGDRAGALQYARTFTVLLREEFGVSPDAEVLALEERLRSEPATAPVAVPEAPAPLPSAPTRASAPPAPRDLGDRGGGRPVRGRVDAHTLAVLPFASVGGEPGSEYFGDGLTEEIITALGQVEGLRVVARTSAFAFKRRNEDIRLIGEQLGVAYVIEGSVRQAGDRLRVVARLVAAADGYELWSEAYDRQLADVFAVQSDIAYSVVRSLRIRLAGESAPLVAASTSDFDAYDLYLRGRHAWYTRTAAGFERARELFVQAIDRDPAYALAHAALADVYNTLGSHEYGMLAPIEAYPRALASARRALALQPDLAAAEASLGSALMHYEWDWTGARSAFSRAIRLNPGYAEVRHWNAMLLAALGEMDEALSEMRRARELDPISPVMETGFARQLYFARDFERAEAAYRRVLQREPSYHMARLGLALCLVQLGRADEAVTALEPARHDGAGAPPAVDALIGYACGRARRTADAEAALRACRARREAGYLPADHLVAVHLGLGQTDEALAALEHAFENRSGGMAYLQIEPLLDPLRAQPRFRQLVERLRFPVTRSAL
jgi:TolB-like protein/DNA-binding SARP family transcriptional activator/Tfp pilus assembly protein PilF